MDLNFALIDLFIIQGPYEIFVRELVAVDGQDQSEILLIDSNGCPTDAAIMGPMNKIDGDRKAIEGPFDAFKFPTSETVQFRALVTPCLPTCEPVQCNVRNYDGSLRELDSFGKRRRRSALQKRSITTNDLPNEEEILVAKAIQIKDKFAFKDKRKNQKDTLAGSSHTDGKLVGHLLITLDIVFFLFLFKTIICLTRWIRSLVQQVEGLSELEID